MEWIFGGKSGGSHQRRISDAEDASTAQLMSKPLKLVLRITFIPQLIKIGGVVKYVYALVYPKTGTRRVPFGLTSTAGRMISSAQSCLLAETSSEKALRHWQHLRTAFPDEVSSS